MKDKKVILERSPAEGMMEEMYRNRKDKNRKVISNAVSLLLKTKKAKFHKN